MSYHAQLLTDGISPAGHRLTTFEITFPRLVLAEFNTHRVLSRNSASSRAIPVKKQLEKVLTEPFVPERFGVNQPGMQAGKYLSGIKHEEAVAIWLRGRNRAAQTAIELLVGSDRADLYLGSSPTAGEMLTQLEAISAMVKDASTVNPAETQVLNVHKQLANRPLEPFMWHTVIVTATEWSNFWALRTHEAAQDEIRGIATLMRELYDVSEPNELGEGEWQRPLTDFPGDDELPEELLTPISAGRCARVSYLTHEQERDPSADVELHDRLVASGHMSPTEHQARAMTKEELRISEWSGNLRGWHQYRKDLPNEKDYSLILAAAGQN